MRSFMGRDILSLKDFEREDFLRVFQVSQDLEPIARRRRNSDLLQHKTLVTAFYQPSTRTRLAHEAAMHRLGGHVLGFADVKNTRAGMAPCSDGVASSGPMSCRLRSLNSRTRYGVFGAACLGSIFGSSPSLATLIRNGARSSSPGGRGSSTGSASSSTGT